jgi:hypothetical protein
MPRTFGRNQVHVSQVVGWTETERPLIEVPPAPGLVLFEVVDERSMVVGGVDGTADHEAVITGRRSGSVRGADVDGGDGSTHDNHRSAWLLQHCGLRMSRRR